MIPCLLYLTASIFGYLLICYLLPSLTSLVKIAGGTAVGLLLLAWYLFTIYAYADRLFTYPLALFGIVLLASIGLFGLCFWQKRPTVPKLTWFETGLTVIIFLCAAWLYWQTFAYNTADHSFQISQIFWGDNGSHLPLMRSFSKTHNFPPQFPLFPGEHLRYHFLFYFLAAMGERLGTNLTVSLNIISALSLTSFSLLVFSLAKQLAHKKPLAGIIAVVLTFFNSSLGFYFFLQQHAPLAPGFLDAITKNQEFIGRGPYDGGIIAAFWNLTTFINQRHLSLALAILLFCVLVFYNAMLSRALSRWSLVYIAILVSLLPFLHSQVFIMAVVLLASAGILFFNWRYWPTYVVSAGILVGLAAPQLMWLQNSSLGQSIAQSCLPLFCQAPSSKFVSFNPGFLIPKPLTFLGSLSWLWWNFGFLLIITPLALLKQTKNHRKLYLSIAPIVLVGLLFQFGPDMATNHKYFNLFLIISNCYIGAFLAWLLLKNVPGTIIGFACLILLTLTGVLELFPVLNTWRITIADIPNNPIAAWVANQTPPDAIFLTSNALYHPVLLSGRKVLLGWQYYAYGAGSDTIGRESIVRDIYTATDPAIACQLLTQNAVSYITIEEGHDDKLYSSNKHFFDQYFTTLFSDTYNNITYTIYEVPSSCQK